jgi:hypothetical protein
MYWRDIWGNTLAESDTSGNIENEYIYFAGKRIAYVTSSGSQYYYLTDQIRSVRKIANASGTLCFDADYTPYGDAVILMNSCPAQPYEFADHGAAFSEPLKDTHDGMRDSEICDPGGYALFFGRDRRAIVP